ncbi:MAG: hypothetical protein R2844_09430 [Caldilineales bacterium]
MNKPQPAAPVQRTIAPVVRKVRLTEQTSDYAFWQTQSFEARLAALEEIRREYHGWTDETERDFREFIESLNANDVRYLSVNFIDRESQTQQASFRAAARPG